MAAWLDLVPEAKGWTLLDTGRLETLVQGMSCPESQYPSLVYFAGNASRVKALQALFPHNNITRRGPAGFIRLHLSTETANCQHPVLFAEGNLRRDYGLSKSSLCPWPTEKLQCYPILQSRISSMADIHQHVLSNLVLPWTQVLCYFVDVSADLYKIRQLLEVPRRKARIGSQPAPDFLHVIVVLIGNEENPDYDAAFEALILYSELEPQLDITFLDLRNRHELSSTAAFEPLRRAVLDHISVIQKNQIDQGFAYSAQHLCRFWRRTLELEMRRLEDSAIDCLAIARESHELNSVKKDHLVSFLQEASESGWDKDEVYAFIASALLMNAYPPSMHPFHPDHVFRELYEHQLLEAWRTQADPYPKISCDSVLTHFKGLFDEMGTGNPSANIRKATLTKAFHRYGGLYSTTSCFVCLCRYPEHMMPCHHSICDTCAVIFGQPSKSAEYHYDMENCPLCPHIFDLTIRQLPPTKRPVILSLDGGGIRGIIQLGLLRSLEKRLGDGISLPQVFDLSSGTSVGAINLMDLVFNKASAEHSFQRFPQFAQEIFGSTSAVRELSIFKCVSWVKCLIGFLADGQYDGKNLEEILKRALGSKRRIFDVGTTPCADCRVAIITSRISDGKACVLANYRGVGVRSTQSAYQFLMPQAHDQNPLLWEAARCSVAAPWFFKPKTLPGFGPLQDGGVRANNPLAIALKESEIIWPKAGKHDLLVSVGTGSKVSGDSISETTRGNVLRDSAVPRLIRATMASPSMDGEQGFFEALNYIPDHMRAGIHRLDHAVSQSLPRLDDVNKVMELAGSTFKVPDNLVHTILVTGFLFFEIDQTPLLKQGAFFCRGSILCKGSNPRCVVNGVRREFPGARFQTTRGYHLGLLDEDDGCCECGYFRKKVAFTVNSLDEMFTIEVATSSTKQKVGGFPTSVQELLSNQQAYNCFGNTDHSIAAWPRRRTCFCLRGTRRFNQLLEPPVGRKKRRLDL